MANDTNNLTFCPFCGGTAVLHANYSRRAAGYFIFAKCTTCGGQGKSFFTEDDPDYSGWTNEACINATRSWNLRAGATEKQEVWIL